MDKSHPSSSTLPPLPPSPSSLPPLPSPPLPSPSLPIVIQQIHCPFQPKQSPSSFVDVSDSNQYSFFHFFGAHLHTLLVSCCPHSFWMLMFIFVINVVFT